MPPPFLLPLCRCVCNGIAVASSEVPSNFWRWKWFTSVRVCARVRDDGFDAAGDVIIIRVRRKNVIEQLLQRPPRYRAPLRRFVCLVMCLFVPLCAIFDLAWWSWLTVNHTTTAAVVSNGRNQRVLCDAVVEGTLRASKSFRVTAQWQLVVCGRRHRF